ncbi:YceD family protein [Swaminathania salitolerans]|uniref:Metal-binding protein n=1 Tax=Swaminathania salitolerans TaxID=182838 RepID=A0A511BPL6_9PROT|nr:DUF177 domain-containing protein [Swaminathania salitolerans]GBQ10867.1 hypothetical protein AA21291_0597 [Swaminathania salitolerans LMG 21291]GEL02205.1 metal-binding protein [Swaminathania salitolerans]
MTDKPEFVRTIRINRIGHEGIVETLEASRSECTALARRFGIPDIHAFGCRFRVTPESGDRFVLEGVLTAHVVLECVITGEPFEDVVNESFVVRLVPAHRFSEETASDIDAVDEIPYEGRDLDLGEVAAEQLALALPAYPRKPGAGLENAVDEAPREMQEEAGERPNPFSALADLSALKKRSDIE